MNYKHTEKICENLRDKSAKMLALLPAVRFSAQHNKCDAACIDEIEKAAYETLRTAQNLNAYAKLCKGEVKKAPFCVVNALFNFTNSARQVCKKSGANIEIKITSEPLYINANEELFYVCIGNIIANSLLYATERAHINFCVYKNNGQAIIKVHDTSKGIKPAAATKAFEEFVSFDPYGEGDFCGENNAKLGLGLAIVKKYSDVFGGRLMTESVWGVGTTVTLALPLCDVPCEEHSEMHCFEKEQRFLCDKYSTLYTQLCEVCELPI